jgi:hypothetical protein
MPKAEYTITIKENSNAEQILTEIDTFFIDIEHKYPNVHVKA